ncbi:MAG: fucose isomerase [Clostridiales bacterium]|mgnify:CR=1 FL=1|nr:fucose isomerase [Clostridiales bacterium]
MELGLITIVSALHDLTSVENSHYELISSLRKDFSFRFITPEEAKNVDMPIVFVASGGTEEMFRNIYDDIPQPIVLLTDGLHNSLAASLEIQSWIKSVGGISQILHGEPEYLKRRIKVLYNLKNVSNKMRKSNIGVIGFPSSWLIASQVNYAEAKKRWGVNYKNIELGQVSDIMKTVSTDEASKIADKFIDNASGLNEPTKKDVIDAAKIYLTIKEICTKNKLDAMTLKCFDVLEKYNISGCLALSLLNDEGIVSGCEGDCQAVFSMYLAKLLTGEIPFMANPSMIDQHTNEAIFAHCTVATSMTEKYIIRNHFESLKSVGIQGEIKEGPITIFKCGGSGLDKYFLSKGEILSNLSSPNMCRTQVRVRLDKNVDYFFKNPIANHHLIIRGDHTELIKEFMDYIGCTEIE